MAMLRMHGIIGWRRNWQILGRADFVFPKLRIAIFVDGCFWHCCSQHGVKPKNNAAFWLEQPGRIQARDRRVTRTLRAQGWKVGQWGRSVTR
jgi:DNA mismatch endonuclease (patch repair protein)